MANFKILSFCGGGIRGLASVVMLDQLQRSCNVNVAAEADMLAGTSAGAGIAAALAAGAKAGDLIEGFWGLRIFNLIGRTDPRSPAYDIAAIAAAADGKYQGTTLEDLNQKILLTSFQLGQTNGPNLLNNAPWGPVLFHNLEGSPHMGTRLADAVVASGAMPGLLGGFQMTVGGASVACVDGAFVHHDPTLAAIALAVNAGIALSEIVVICFGTGFMANSIGSTATVGWGAQQWQQGVSGTAPYCMQPLLANGAVSPILNISLNGASTNLVPQLSEMLLADQPRPRYAYLNPILDRFVPENETNSAVLQELVTLARNGVDYSAAEAIVGQYWLAGAGKEMASALK